jgi:hypothetical protein
MPAQNLVISPCLPLGALASSDCGRRRSAGWLVKAEQGHGGMLRSAEDGRSPGPMPRHRRHGRDLPAGWIVKVVDQVVFKTSCRG